jgi:hypothetical protein
LSAVLMACCPQTRWAHRLESLCSVSSNQCLSAQVLSCSCRRNRRQKIQLIPIPPPSPAAATIAFGKSIPVPFPGRTFPKRGMILAMTISSIAL